MLAYIAMAGIGGIAWGKGWKWWAFLPVAVNYVVEYQIIWRIIEDSNEYQWYGTYPAVYDGIIYTMWAVGIIVCIWMVRRGRKVYATRDTTSEQREADKTGLARFCQECGHKCFPHDKFCKQCGHELT